MLTPARPRLARSVLDLVARLDFQPFAGPFEGLGTFAAEGDRTWFLAIVEGATPGRMRWAIIERARAHAGGPFPEVEPMPPGVGPLMFRRSTWDVLRSATLDTSGALCFDGYRYELALWYVGECCHAALVDVGPAVATSTPGSAASERCPSTGPATTRSPEAITRPMPRTPLGRLSPSEIPAPLRAQASGAQDAPGALGLAHVALDGDWLHPRRGVHGEGFVDRGGFRVVPVLPRDAPRPSPAPPDSTPAEPTTRPELTPPRPLLDRDLLAVAARLDYRPIGGGAWGTFASDGDLSVALSVVEGPGPGQARWTALELPSTPRPATYEALRGRQGPPGLGPVMFSREVWAALRAGTLDASGALLHEGRLHDLGWWFDRGMFTARLLLVDEAA
ncbi:hypothetical protein [Sorangium sp. So ce363]|uniref:hypothetical protein n=1 Tax=Sorangium sp. So ce363 TaxID=3133304 RepID=UPI003F61B013